MPEVTDDSPFRGARTCYRRAYRLLDWMRAHGFVQVSKDRRGRMTGCATDPEMDRLIEALDKGDEEIIKGYLIDPRFIDAAHETSNRGKHEQAKTKE